MANVDKARIDGLIYSFLLAMGAMLLSSGDVRSAHGLGVLLVASGLLFPLFFALELLADDAEYQGTITLVLLLIVLGRTLMAYGSSPRGVLGALLLSTSLGRLLGLLGARIYPSSLARLPSVLRGLAEEARGSPA